MSRLLWQLPLTLAVLVTIANSMPIPARNSIAGFDLQQLISNSGNAATKSTSCTICRIIVQGIQFLIENDSEDEKIDEYVT